MTVREMVEKLRINQLVEIRSNNVHLITCDKDGLKFLDKSIPNRIVLDWGTNEGLIFLNCEGVNITQSTKETIYE